MLSYCCGGSLGRFCEAWPEGCILRGLHVCDVWAVAFVVLCQQLQTKLCLTSIAIFSITTKPQAHRAAWSSELQDTTTHAKTQGTCDTPNPMQFHKWWIFSNLKSWSFWVLHVDNGQSNGTSSFACGDCHKNWWDLCRKPTLWLQQTWLVSELPLGAQWACVVVEEDPGCWQSKVKHDG